MHDNACFAKTAILNDKQKYNGRNQAVRVH